MIKTSGTSEDDMKKRAKSVKSKKDEGKGKIQKQFNLFNFFKKNSKKKKMTD